MDLQKVREKAHAEGYCAGVIAERLQTIGLLGRIAEADDIEAALMAEHERLLSLQAREVAAAQHATGDDAEARAFRHVQDAVAVGSGQQPIDNSDRVAAGLGLLELPASAWAKPAAPAHGRQLDAGDLVAAAMGLQPAGGAP